MGLHQARLPRALRILFQSSDGWVFFNRQAQVLKSRLKLGTISKKAIVRDLRRHNIKAQQPES